MILITLHLALIQSVQDVTSGFNIQHFELFFYRIKIQILEIYSHLILKNYTVSIYSTFYDTQTRPFYNFLYDSV